MSKLPKIKIFPDLDTDTKITLWIIASIAGAILLYISIWPFGNFAGGFGQVIGSFINLLLGRGSFLLPLAFVYTAAILIRVQKNQELLKDINGRVFWGIGFMLLAFNGLVSLFLNVQNLQEVQNAGGVLGYIMYPWIFGALLGKIGTFLILVTFGFFGFFLLSNLTFVQFLQNIKETLKDPSQFLDFIPDVFEIWNKTKTKMHLTHEPKIEIAPVENEIIETQSARNPEITETKTQTQLDQDIQPTHSIPKNPSWQLPPFDLLKESTDTTEPGDIEKNKGLIRETLANFNIMVEMGEVFTGPTVTQYTLKPAQGVRLSTIDNLQRDLALALAVSSLRIEAPIAGKSLVGIEIPNKKKSQVRLRQIVQTKHFTHYAEPLAVVIGKDVTGNNLIFSLAKMPHLLVAGATGSGKSVWINSMLLSLFYHYSPRDLQVILVDMKRVELKLYEGVPHLLSKVITEPEKAINALKWTLLEMEKRYKILEEFGKRNILDYNHFAKQEKLETLPYLTFIIDELGDLMMMAKNEVEPIVVRLTQMSRAVGIHLVLGTQRPDTQVVTGLIKANIPSRISFAVASQIDSRVILDKAGAEKLLGQGDGLFMNPNSVQPIRFQGANLEEWEVKRCVDFLRDQALEKNWDNNLKPEVVEVQKVKINIPGMPASSNSEEEGGEVFEEAKRLVIQYQKASASFLQQMMGIGYPKAARIINDLEAMGVVGPQNGSKPRDVYSLAEEAMD